MPAVAPVQLTREEEVAFQEELIAGYSEASFFPRLHKAWYSADDMIERMRLRQQVCMEVQAPVLGRYGFEPSPKGVAQSAHYLGKSRDPEILFNNLLLTWMCKPDDQVATLRPSSFIPHAAPEEHGYRVAVTGLGDDAAICGIERCRGQMALAHQRLYKPVYPGVNQDQWMKALGSEGIRKDLEKGTIVLHAALEASGAVVGYISCSCFYSDAGSPAGESEEGPYAKINHISVLPDHQCHGVGRLLFDELLQHLHHVSPSVTNDLRLNVVELNGRAQAWYRRLGFFVVQLWMRRLNSGSFSVPVAFMQMQRRGADAGDDPGSPPQPWERFFGSELRHYKAAVMHDSAPPTLLMSLTCGHLEHFPLADITSFDVTTGLHTLGDGRTVDLTMKFVCGRVQFDQPLHTILTTHIR